MPKPPRGRPRELTLTIASVARGGDGVAHADLDGRPRAVFVPHTVPGDVVVATVDASSSPARGTLLRVEKEGPTRTPPACAVFATCGGCDAMHMTLDGQRDVHRALVRAALPPSSEGTDVTSHRSPKSEAYRTRARVSVVASGGRARVGMREGGSKRTVETPVCLVLDPRVDAARLALPALFEGAHGEGDVQLALGGDAGSAKAVAHVRWNGSLPGSVYGRVERAVTEGAFAGVAIVESGVSKPVTVGDPRPRSVAPDGEVLEVGTGGFAQANDGTNAALVTHVTDVVRSRLRHSEDGRRTKVVELHAGAGNLTVALARLDVDLVAVEAVREACEAARSNLARRGLRAKVQEGRAEEAALPPNLDVLVLDPPRTGAREVAEAIARGKGAREKPACIVYVSCDPSTLGRDLAILEGDYAVVRADAFEMFPHTSHVESVVVLARRKGKATP